MKKRYQTIEKIIAFWESELRTAVKHNQYDRSQKAINMLKYWTAKKKEEQK